MEFRSCKFLSSSLNQKNLVVLLCSLICCHHVVARTFVFLVEWILGRMKKKFKERERERERMSKKFWRVFGWEVERGKEWWGQGVFSSGLPKNFLPKMGRKLGGRSLMNKWQKCPFVLAYGLHLVCCFFFFFFSSSFKFFIFLGTHSLFFFCFLGCCHLLFFFFSFLFSFDFLGS